MRNYNLQASVAATDKVTEQFQAALEQNRNRIGMPGNRLAFSC